MILFDSLTDEMVNQIFSIVFIYYGGGVRLLSYHHQPDICLNFKEPSSPKLYSIFKTSKFFYHNVCACVLVCVFAGLLLCLYMHVHKQTDKYSHTSKCIHVYKYQ